MRRASAHGRDTGTLGQTLGGSQDVFVPQLTAASGALQWSSYLGGNAAERVAGIVATSNSGAIVFRDTDSSDFPVVSAFDSTFSGMNDAFITKIAGDGASLVTDANGQCTFTRTLSNSITSTTLEVTGAAHPTLAHNAAANHNPVGASITVNKP